MRILLAGVGVVVTLAAMYVGCGLSTQGNNVGGFDEKDGGLSSSSSTGAGGSGPDPCTSRGDCKKDTDCATYQCEQGYCQLKLEPAGTEVAVGQVEGDCKKIVCSPSGAPTPESDNGDTPNSTVCNTKSCDNGEVTSTPAPDGTSCGAGLFCKGGVCKGCTTASDCPASEDDCLTSQCINSACALVNTLDGMEVGDNSDKTDCVHTVCKAGMKTVDPDTDEIPPSDGSDCTSDACGANGKATYSNLLDGINCGGLPKECYKQSVCESGVCKEKPKPVELLGSDGIDGNCKSNFCDGAGNIEAMPDDMDPPLDNDKMDCKVPHCEGGKNMPADLPNAAACGPTSGDRCCGGLCCASMGMQFCQNSMTCCASGVICGDTCCPMVGSGCSGMNNATCCASNKTCGMNCCMNATDSCLNDNATCCPQDKICNSNTVCCGGTKKCVGGNACI